MRRDPRRIHTACVAISCINSASKQVEFANTISDLVHSAIADGVKKSPSVAISEQPLRDSNKSEYSIELIKSLYDLIAVIDISHRSPSSSIPLMHCNLSPNNNAAATLSFESRKKNRCIKERSWQSSLGNKFVSPGQKNVKLYR